MDRATAKTRAIERLRERGATDPIAVAHLIEARITMDPAEMITIADTCDISTFEGLADKEPAIQGVRGEYDGRREREELEAKARLVPSVESAIQHGGGDDDVRFVSNLK